MRLDFKAEASAFSSIAFPRPTFIKTACRGNDLNTDASTMSSVPVSDGSATINQSAVRHAAFSLHAFRRRMPVTDTPRHSSFAPIAWPILP
jgi:hypothetical protein